MSTTHRIVSAWLLVAAGLLGRAEQSAGQGREPAAPQVRGVVKETPAKGTIIVSIGGGREAAATDKTYTLAQDVEVCVSAGFGGSRGGVFKEAKLADLAAGTMVTLFLGADLKTVDSIVAEDPVVRGVVKAVDAAKRTLTVSTSTGGREQPAADDKTYTVAANAEIALDDGRGRRTGIQEGQLENLSQGALVTLRLTLDRSQVHGILAEGATLTGVVKALDTAKRSITLTMRPARGDDAGEERTLAIAQDAIVLVDDGKGRRLSVKEAKLDEIPLGSLVMMRLSIDQVLIRSLRAEGPTLFGLLKAVDAEKGTITIAIPRGRDQADEKTLTIAKDARVTLDGNATRLADLKVADNGPFIQLRLTLDQKTVQSVTARLAETR